MLFATLLFFVGIALSAFFSGSETGFYRVPRVRLVIDGVAGSRLARGLLWASNNPTAFVATALVGNNLANYVTSLAVVIAAGYWFPSGGLAAELIPPLLLAPLVFVYGELLPKQAFLDAPYRLLKLAAPAMALAAIVLLPISGVLWLVSRTISRLSGASNEPLRMSLRRRELTSVLAEGHEVGLLVPAQRDLAFATFALGGKPIRDYLIPLARHPRLPVNTNREAVLATARKRKQDALPVATGKRNEKSFGCLRASHCLLMAPGDPLPIEPLPTFAEDASFLEVITHLESNAQPLAAIKSLHGRVLGFVRLAKLQQALWNQSSA